MVMVVPLLGGVGCALFVQGHWQHAMSVRVEEEREEKKYLEILAKVIR
mgnify:FL=1|jgi:hypothetical protein|tara:strand:- start:24 stop:167 length:144 start_codon:yes stop_codon:yes gene_type:complete